MTEAQYLRKMDKIKEKNAQIERKQKLDEERNKYKSQKKLSASKLVLIGVIAICVEIVWFCEHLMLMTFDTSALYALIAIPATLAPTVWGYYSKSKAENTAGGITYDMAMAQMEMYRPETDDADEVDEDGSVG